MTPAMHPSGPGTGPGPGRPRSFDEDTALDRAIDVFRERGYDGTSYPLLEEATGLHRQSLRYAFGDKKSLFRRALERYIGEKDALVAAALAGSGPAVERLRAVFRLWAADAAEPVRRGCLMVNSMVERGEAGGVAAGVLVQANGRLRTVLAAAFAAARAEGAVRTGLDPADLAQQALALADGLVLHARAGDGNERVPAVFESFLTQIAP